MGRAAKNLHRNLINGKDKSNPDSTRIMPDATSVARKPRGDNTLSTMDKYGVEDVVRNLSKGPKKDKAGLTDADYDAGYDSGYSKQLSKRKK